VTDVWPFLTVGLFVWVGINGVAIVMQRRPAASTIAWLLLLVLVPIGGLIVYRLLGPLSLKRRKQRLILSKRVVDEGLRGLHALDAHVEHHQMAMVSMGIGGTPPYRAASVDIYFDGASAYSAILAAVAEAKDHIHLEYYIWEPDTIGTRLRDALVERARAGVKVRMLVDATGSHHLRQKFLQPLHDAGVAVAWFNPVRLRTLRRRRADFRTHRKIVVVDGRVGFTGGMNITDDHNTWRDTHVRIAGPPVWPMQRIFFEDWYFAAEEMLPTTLAQIPQLERDGEHLVQIVASGPDTTDFAIHKVYFTAINGATRRCWLSTPYFVPDEALMTALVTAALRGVDVRLIVPLRGDSRLVDLAARSYFLELLAANIRVYEYTPRFTHAKTMLCDDDVSIIGTANLDFRSFRLNFELAALLFGTTANHSLADAFERDLTDCREVTIDACTSLSFPRRFGQASARLLSPLL
jgi:cardiolipin synthase